MEIHIFKPIYLNITYDGAVIDLRSVRHLYSQYLIYYHLTPDYGSNDCNLLFDLMNYSSSMNSITKRSMVWWKRITTKTDSGSQDGAWYGQ